MTEVDGAAPASAAVLVPVKAFSRAKLRLAPALNPGERVRLARWMAEQVVAAAHPLPVAVVCDDDDVASWARDAGASVVWAPRRGLNGAVAFGVDTLREAGVDRVVVAHADLPYASKLAALALDDGVILVPDRRDDGTNVASIPSRCGFRFSYGPGSFGRHADEAVRLGLPLRVLRDVDLVRDVDLPEDLLGLASPA